MIASVPFYHMRADEYRTFADVLVEIISDHSSPVSDIQPSKLKLSTAIDKLDEHLVKPSTKLETLKVRAMNKKRNNAFLALRDYLRACNRREDEGWNEASQLLLDLINEYGTRLYRESSQVKSARITNLISIVETNEKMKAAVSLMNVGEWIEPLKNAQAGYEQARDIRMELNSSISKSKVQEACLEIENTCKLIFQYLEVMSEIEPADEYGIMINRINVEIHDVTTTIHIRRGKKGNGKSD